MQAEDFGEEVLQRSAGFEAREGDGLVRRKGGEGGGAKVGEDVWVEGEADEAPGRKVGGLVRSQYLYIVGFETHHPNRAAVVSRPANKIAAV